MRTGKRGETKAEPLTMAFFACSVVLVAFLSFWVSVVSILAMVKTGFVVVKAKWGSVYVCFMCSLFIHVCTDHPQRQRRQRHTLGSQRSHAAQTAPPSQCLSV